MGNPNIGKSVVFSRLTGANVVASNYPGTTVDFTKGKMRLARESAEVIDVPGTYSLKPTTKAEEVAIKMLEEGDLVINVVDSTNLERNLYLTLELLERNVPVIVALNLWDEAKHKGITIDAKKLEKLLGVPVVPTVALTGEGIKKLISRLKDARIPRRRRLTEKERWARIGSTIKKVEKVEHRHHTIRESISDATVKPATGILIAIAVISVAFLAVRFIGENLIGYVFEPIFDLYEPVAMGLSDLLGGSGILHDMLIGNLIEGEIVWTESMGLLTTGIFMPFAMVLPYIIAFFIILSILEDTGYLPRLGTLADNVFHRLGMHGYGIVPTFLGLGCNVPGALSTRIFETRKQRFISATLLAIAIPCMAQIAMIFGVLGDFGITPILIVFLTLAMIYVVFGLLMNRFVKGESPEIFLEVPPYRRPSIGALLKKVWMRVRWFLREALPWLFLGVVVVNLLYSFGVLEALGEVTGPFMEGWFGLPGAASLALLVGFVRKDLAVGMLLPLGMSAMQLVIAVTILVIYFPCAATFAVLIRELGWKDMFKSTLIMIGTALLVGGLMRITLLGV
jgi:ferrous iron transport protein B